MDRVASLVKIALRRRRKKIRAGSPVYHNTTPWETRKKTSSGRQSIAIFLNSMKMGVESPVNNSLLQCFSVAETEENVSMVASLGTIFLYGGDGRN